MVLKRKRGWVYIEWEGVQKREGKNNRIERGGVKRGGDEYDM